MFDIITRFVSDLKTSEEPEKFIHDRKQLAEAVLMYHVIAVDGIVTDGEKNRMGELISKQFGLDEKTTASLVWEAQTADKDAIDLYSFTSVLKRTLNENERVTIVENLWEMVFADGVIHELEDNVVWRIAELLAVDSRSRMLMKKKVADRRMDAT